MAAILPELNKIIGKALIRRSGESSPKRCVKGQKWEGYINQFRPKRRKMAKTG